MITANMDCFEIHKCALRAIPLIEKKLSWVSKRVVHELRKNREASIPVSLFINVDNTKYMENILENKL